MRFIEKRNSNVLQFKNSSEKVELIKERLTAVYKWLLSCVTTNTYKTIINAKPRKEKGNQNNRKGNKIQRK